MLEMKFYEGVHTKQFTGVIKSIAVKGYMSQKGNIYKKLQMIFENDELGGLFLMINIQEDGSVNESSDGGRLLKSLQTQGFGLDMEILNASEELKPESTTETMYEAVVTAAMGGRKDVPVVMTPYPRSDGNLKWECTGTGTVDTTQQATLGLSNMIRLNAESILPALPNPFTMSDFVMAINSNFGEAAPEINNVKDAIMVELVQRNVLVRDGDKFRKVGA